MRFFVLLFGKCFPSSHLIVGFLEDLEFSFVIYACILRSRSKDDRGAMQAGQDGT